MLACILRNERGGFSRVQTQTTSTLMIAAALATGCMAGPAEVGTQTENLEAPAVDGGAPDPSDEMPESPPPDGPYQGHADPNPRPYNIWIDNCHTAANAFVLADPALTANRGIISCQGNPQSSPAYHTTNWEVFPEEGYTCFYNWGDSCCFEGTDNPPQITPGSEAEYCAQEVCQDQFAEGVTQALNAGDLVQIPGYAACVRQAAGIGPNQLGSSNPNLDPANYRACMDCCDQQASMWDPNRWGQAAQDDFRNTCRSLCRGFYEHPNYGSGTAFGGQCADNTTIFSIHSRYEQCRGCCLDGALGHEYPRDQVNQCLAVCNERYPQ